MASIDAPHQLVDVALQLGVGGHALARGHRDLHEAHLIAQLRRLLQQAIDGVQPPRDALGVVEPVDPQHDGAATGIGADGLGARDHVGAVGQGVEALGVDAHRVNPQPRDPRPQRDAVVVSRQPEHLGDRGREVVAVLGDVEADQIGAQHALQDRGAPGQDAEDLGRRKRDVQEEADAGLGQLLADHGRGQGQLVVVDPDQVAGAMAAHDLVGEAAVDGPVDLPLALGVEPDLVEQVVEQRPQHAVREAVVVARDLVPGQLHRDRAQLAEALGDELACLAAARQLTGPAQPQGLAHGVDIAERRGQPARRGLQPGPVGAVLHRHRESIGHDQESRLRGFARHDLHLLLGVVRGPSLRPVRY